VGVDQDHRRRSLSVPSRLGREVSTPKSRRLLLWASPATPGTCNAPPLYNEPEGQLCEPQDAISAVTNVISCVSAVETHEPFGAGSFAVTRIVKVPMPKRPEVTAT